MEIHLFLWIFSAAGSGFNDKSDLDPSLYNQDWMGSIPDETFISAIPIPGTQESLSLTGGPLVVSQVWSLEKQLRVGVRYFDLRAWIWLSSSTDIDIRNGNWGIPQGATLASVFREVLGFLDAHRSEAVLMKVTPSGLFQDSVAQKVKKLVEKFESRIWAKVSVPTLKQVRGKIVFLQNKHFTWGTENHKSKFFESNKLTDVEYKIKHVRWHLCGHYILLTETASPLYRSPKTLARSVNQQLSHLVRSRRRSGCLGVLSLAFPSAALIRDIIGLGVCGCGPPEPSGPGPEPPPGPETPEPE
uniref:Phosphatidylinositol-specific phospholipase C X domain-containing protein n=1 Tax=Fundulus heteroclitus TaxID=8078 RepID=A0A3Q2Q434_FUNHE